MKKTRVIVDIKDFSILDGENSSVKTDNLKLSESMIRGMVYRMMGGFGRTPSDFMSSHKISVGAEIEFSENFNSEIIRYDNVLGEPLNQIMVINIGSARRKMANSPTLSKNFYKASPEREVSEYINPILLSKILKKELKYRDHEWIQCLMDISRKSGQYENFATAFILKSEVDFFTSQKQLPSDYFEKLSSLKGSSKESEEAEFKKAILEASAYLKTVPDPVCRCENLYFLKKDQPLINKKGESSVTLNEVQSVVKLYMKLSGVESLSYDDIYPAKRGHLANKTTLIIDIVGPKLDLNSEYKQIVNVSNWGWGYASVSKAS